MTRKTQTKKWLNPFADFYYVVTTGEREGIYSDYDEALEAAWLSNDIVKTYKSLHRAESAFKRSLKDMERMKINPARGI